MFIFSKWHLVCDTHICCERQSGKELTIHEFIFLLLKKSMVETIAFFFFFNPYTFVFMKRAPELFTGVAG